MLYRGWTYARRVDFDPYPSGGQGGIPGKRISRSLPAEHRQIRGNDHGGFLWLLQKLVGEPHDYLIGRFKDAQREFAQLPHEQQPEVMGDISGLCMYDMLHYAYAHLEECKLILCCSEGTRFSGLIDEMVEIEVESTHTYLAVLNELGRPSPKIDPKLEHILITGMFHTFFELVIHEMPLRDAENYIREMRAFYTAGWMKIMGQ